MQTARDHMGKQRDFLKQKDKKNNKFWFFG